MMRGGAFGRELGSRGGALLMELVPLQEEMQERWSLSLGPCEDTVKSWPCENQEEGSHQTPNPLAP